MTRAAGRNPDDGWTFGAVDAGTARDLAESAAGLAFESRGRYSLKGLEREHALFAAASSTG